MSQTFKHFFLNFQPLFLKTIVSIAAQLQSKADDTLEAARCLLYLCCPRSMDSQILLKMVKKG